MEQQADEAMRLFTSIELKVIQQFVQITYSCLEEAVHAGLKQRALCPPPPMSTRQTNITVNKALFQKHFFSPHDKKKLSS